MSLVNVTPFAGATEFILNGVAVRHHDRSLKKGWGKLTSMGVGVIGCGAFGEKHVAAYSQMKGVTVRVVCDQDPERAKYVAGKYHVEHYASDIQEALSVTDLHAVSIVTPESYHHQHTMLALRAGLHVFVEKPMATSVEQADEMISAAESNQLVLVPGHILRFEPRYVLAHERMQSLGKVHSVYCRRNLPRNLRNIYTRVHPALMTLPHDIDLVLWFVGDEPRKVYAVERSTLQSGAIDSVWALVQFRNGTVACFESCWLLPERHGITPESRMDVVCENGRIHISYPATDFCIQDDRVIEHVDSTLWPEYRGGVKGALFEELSHFVDCVIQNRESEIVPPEAGRKAVMLAHAIVKSARAGAEITIS